MICKVPKKREDFLKLPALLLVFLCFFCTFAYTNYDPKLCCSIYFGVSLL